MQQPEWHTGHDRETLARDLAEYVASRLTKQLAQQARVSLAVSGGSTPALFFQYLSRCKLPWHRVDIVPVDERWVEAGSDQVNESLMRTQLLQGGAARAAFFPVLGEAEDPDNAVQKANHRLEAVVSPLTVAVMGMGDDGHTASWFPGDSASAQALSEGAGCGYRITYAPSTPRTRLTLAWPCIRDAEHCLLHIHGEEKRHVLEEVLAAADGGPQYPVQRLLQRPLSVFWSP